MPEAEPLPENTYQIVITAAGEVRDADGNLLNVVEGVGEPQVVTESQLKELLEKESA